MRFAPCCAARSSGIRRCAGRARRRFREALQTWQTPALVAAPKPAAGTAGGGTLDFLLRRMRHKSDFPAMSDAVARIQRLTASDRQNLNALADEILKDVALTNKLLRLVNSAKYCSAAGAITTVSRAIALVGLAGLRNLATSLVMLEHMHDKAHAAQLREEFLRALLAAMLASELGGVTGDGEEAFVAAMFHHLGRCSPSSTCPRKRARCAASLPRSRAPRRSSRPTRRCRCSASP